jgi:uncharacterized protein YbjT (DUF2867 family)
VSSNVLLLTGATGTIGRPLLRRLIAAGHPVRCLVRDPRRLGAERVNVQIALGDLGDHLSFRNALRGVDTVLHLASVIRDQPHGSIEELVGVASWRLVQAAEREGVERFVLFSVTGASPRAAARLLRAKAHAERALTESELAWTIFGASMVYTPGDHYLRLLERLALLPAIPIPGDGRARFEPVWAEDVVAATLAALPQGPHGEAACRRRYELAGPEILRSREIVAAVAAAAGRRRPVLPVPLPVARRLLRAVELLGGPTAFATWDEAELLQHTLLSAGGPADLRALDVEPRRLADVLGVA